MEVPVERSSLPEARAERRLARTLHHLANGSDDSQCMLGSQECKSVQIVNNEPRKKEKLKWNGWGYADSKFLFNKSGNIYMSGHRYNLAGVELPYLREFVEKEMSVTLDDKTNPNPPPKSFPQPIENQQFLRDIEGSYVRVSFDGMERLAHGHGHTCQEIWDLRYGKFPRIPDAVIYPGRHEDVEVIVRAANTHNVVIIPYGGGTSVSTALICPANENRMIISLDMHEMDKIKWVDRENMTACIEAGIVGKDLARKLEDIGLTMGHEPDSLEFSTLGGWVATRASGMKKNTYGNIEDIVVNIKLVTPIGTLTREGMIPRISAGPDINEIIMGSEGTLGVVTETVVKVRPLPEVRRYGALAFPDFESGVKFMHEVGIRRLQPASLRLVDPPQFRFSQALKPAPNNWLEALAAKAKKMYVSQWLQFDLNEICAATLVFEGTKEEVRMQENNIYSLAKKYGGVKADEENGRRGYYLTFMIAYLRDMGMDLSFLAESFETSVPWSKTATICRRVKERIAEECKKQGITVKPFISCRVTQTYDTGSCVYFYFGFSHKGLSNPIDKFTHVEHAARDEIMKCGGSISHHHGIGKHRKEFFERQVTAVGIETLRGIKKTVDPKNIFANGNMFDVDPSHPSSAH